jgi:hypothetical protein
MALWACESSSSQSTEEADTRVTASRSASTSPADEATVRIKTIEEGAYPFYTLLAETIKGAPLVLSLNLEEVGNLTPDALNNLLEKSVWVRYKTQQEDAVMDIELNGKTLLGEYGGQRESGWKKVGGVLSASEVSQGDLPGTIHVVSTDGTKHQYKFYITEEVAQAHGKQVVVYYDPRINYVVTSLRME